MKKFLSLICLLSLPSFAAVTVTHVDCPVQFEGSVKEVVQELGPERPMGFQKVIFENHHNLKGNAPKQVLLDVLQHGPFSIEPGADYRVQLRDGKLCWIERL